MLLRHGRQSLSLHHAAVLRPLRLTPRCPFTTINATPAVISRRRLSTQQDARPATRRESTRAAGGSSNTRNLATAVDEHQSIDDSPYGRLNSSIMPSNNPLSQLRSLDGSSPLVILEEELAVMRTRERMNPHGVPGTVEEMHLVFDACIRVGKIDRAQLVLKRLSSFEGYPKEELTLLHNRYLRASLDQMRLLPDRAQAEQLHKWYETHIRSQRMPQTAETIACMLKASLLSERDPLRLKRFVTRYMEMAPGEAGLEVLSMADILNDQDLAIITDLCPTYNLAPGDAEAAEAGAEAEAEAQAPESSSPQDGDLARPIPEVLATPQKGSGLRTVKSTLSLFDELPQNSDFSLLSPRERREIQLRLEKDCIDAAIERWREDNESLNKMGLGASLTQASLNSRLYDWQTALESRIKQEMISVEAAEAAKKKSPEDLDRCVYGPLLRLSKPSRLAAVTILSALNAVGTTGAGKGVTLTSTLAAIAKAVEDDTKSFIRNQRADKNTTQNKRKRVVLTTQANSAATEEAGSSLMGNDVRREAHLVDGPWPAALRLKLAAVLLTALFDSAKIQVIKEHPETKALVSQFQPAFSHVQQLKRGKKVGMFLCNKNLVEHLTREPRGDYLAKQLPMVVEPEPWTAFNKGGFLGSECSLVRVKAGDRDQRLYTEAAAARGDMDQVFKGLDVLGRTAWRINMPVFEVMLEAWNTGEAFAKFPPLRPNVQVPEEPAASDDPSERRWWIRAVKAAENEKSGQHSVRCFVNFQMEIARAFRNQTFYFPHNVDFRGRAYPIPTYLNHMGADHSRGLLRFAKGRELGERGFEWLKIHLANVYGFDKASLKDRAAFAMDNLVNVFDSANKPLTGNKWWLKAEDPWQCLAVCFELKAALESPDPTKFVSHLPIHQDGTCNGLQHYAALGGDSLGARQVNLEPGDKPADVYSAVADIVKEHIAKDVEAGDPKAMALSGKITRKVVKQTVMTNVYGVTYVGAKKQVCKQIDALYPNLGKETGLDHMYLAAYVATLIFKALSTMFNGAHNIQTWLGEVGARICKSLSAEQLQQMADADANGMTASGLTVPVKDLIEQFRATIVWTTPLRMPVAQPYRKPGSRVITTSMQTLTLKIPNRSDPVHSRKQLQAFPPNFIHSLDATHMLLSALACGERNVTFAAVHDSFWTHAADVDVMNSALRDAFVKIHQEDVIGRLAAEINLRYGGSIYMANVDIRTPAGREIAKLRSKNPRGVMRSELEMEYKRQTLLRSDKPEEVEEGKKMVTPASIIESMGGTDAVVHTEDLSGSGIGVIDERAPSVDLEDGGVDGELSADAGEEVDGEDSSKPHAAETVMSSFESQVVVHKDRQSNHKPHIIQCWLPLTLPPLPKKGDFVVERLKESKYFFS
ncbi:DNA-directed RNA mitochondrial polymerase [Colletotrichum musicola]|uniref:DNA-directed RNA polymerase n=1 Tax=Colletotrichum musicola TaxID=2175873 RepID=A0A8H6MQH7_9PEZI|nr:DNA-directed RNA mitochondrial polymerase [Colletotrichum musicola]